jgi:hypothetical protein
MGTSRAVEYSFDYAKAHPFSHAITITPSPSRHHHHAITITPSPSRHHASHGAG